MCFTLSADWGLKIDVVGFCFLHLASNYVPLKLLVDCLEEEEKPIYVGFGSLVSFYVHVFSSYDYPLMNLLNTLSKYNFFQIAFASSVCVCLCACVTQWLVPHSGIESNVPYLLMFSFICYCRHVRHTCSTLAYV